MGYGSSLPLWSSGEEDGKLSFHLGLCPFSRRKLTWVAPMASLAFVVMQFFSFGGFLFASSLIVLRAYVDFSFASWLLLHDYIRRVEIWEHNKVVVGVSAATWLINLGACIRCAFYSFYLAFRRVQLFKQVQVWP